MSTGAVVDPHNKMRARDISKVARGEQAPRPSHDHDTVSKAPPPSSTDPKPKAKKDEEDGRPSADAPRFTNQMRNCCIRYYEYYKCMHENKNDTPKCDKFADEFQALCPNEWIAKWDKERELGLFPGPL